MRKFTFTIPTLLFSCLLLASAALADVTTFKSRGKLAYAQYYQYTDSYSNALAVDVFVSEAIIQIGANRTFTPWLFVQIYGINYATDQSFFMSGETNQFVFTVRGDLAAAEVSGNVVVMDSLGNSKQVSLALSFQGGALTRDLAHYGWSSGLSRTVVTTLSAVRFSDSVTGSLVVGGSDLLSSSNLTDFSGISGVVTNSSGASIDIIRMR